MKLPFLRTAAYNVVCHRSLRHFKRSRKYHTIRQNSQGKWLTILSPFTTFTAYLSMGFLNSRLATSFAPIDDIHTQLMRKRFPCCLLMVAFYMTRPRLPLMFFSSQSKKSAFLSNLLMSLYTRSIKFRQVYC